MIQMRGEAAMTLPGALARTPRAGSRPRIPRLSPARSPAMPLPYPEARVPGTTKRPEEPSRSGSGSACTGRFDHRGQGVRGLLARTADRAPTTAGTTHQALYIPTSAATVPRSGPEIVADPRTFTKIVH